MAIRETELKKQLRATARDSPMETTKDNAYALLFLEGQVFCCNLSVLDVKLPSGQTVEHALACPHEYTRNAESLALLTLIAREHCEWSNGEARERQYELISEKYITTNIHGKKILLFKAFGHIKKADVMNIMSNVVWKFSPIGKVSEGVPYQGTSDYTLKRGETPPSAIFNQLRLKYLALVD